MTTRRRAATLLLAVGLGVIVVDLWRRAPREIRVHFRFAEARQKLEAINVRYEREGDLIREATFRYADEAPYQQTHRVRLARGSYAVKVRLDYEEGPRHRRLAMEVGSEDDITLAGPW